MMSDQAMKRYKALGACMTIIEANIRAFSRNQAALEPKEGYEAAFREEQENAACIREMMQEVRYGQQGQEARRGQ